MAVDDELVFHNLPPFVADVLRGLAAAGHEAALVGGVVRDRLRGGVRPDADWDVATSGRPEEVAPLFRGAIWENRFGTVTVVGPPRVEITSYRTEGTYGDRRRPDEVRFGATLEEDLARRDFTINAMAWIPGDAELARGRVVDPHGGAHDLAAAVLRTVGEPRERFTEDALRLVRAARFAGRFSLEVDERTEAAVRELAPTVAAVSKERIRDELTRVLDAEQPSAALAHLERMGLMAVLLPELQALRGIPQAKVVPGDALDHTYRAVDAAPSTDIRLRVAALLHDVGKAATMAGGHFIDHDRVGAELAAGVLDRLRWPRTEAREIVAAIRHHMYAYESSWSDAAVRRFIRRVGVAGMPLLFALRRADNAASGVGDAGARAQAELDRRIAAELDRSRDLLERSRLAIDGHELQRELELAPGPALGAIIDRLMALAVDDPSVNERGRLLELARRMQTGAVTAPTDPEPDG